MKKHVSRLERLNRSPKSTFIPCNDELLLQKENYETEGRIMSRMVQKTVNPSDTMSKFKVSDFTTENLLAIGAKDHFRPMSSLPTSDIDTALAAMDKLSSIRDSMSKPSVTATPSVATETPAPTETLKTE